EGADRGARQGGAQGISGGRKRRLHRRNGRTRGLKDADRRVFRPCDYQRPRRRQARTAPQPAAAFSRRGERGRGFLEDRGLGRRHYAFALAILDRSGAKGIALAPLLFALFMFLLELGMLAFPGFAVRDFVLVAALPLAAAARGQEHSDQQAENEDQS